MTSKCQRGPWLRWSLPRLGKAGKSEAGMRLVGLDHMQTEEGAGGAGRQVAAGQLAGLAGGSEAR